MNAVVIRKAFGDYLDVNDNYRSGKFWEVKIPSPVGAGPFRHESYSTGHGEIVLRYPGSRSKKQIIAHIQDNLGSDVEIFERVA